VRAERAQGVDATSFVCPRRELQFRRAAEHRPRIARRRGSRAGDETQQGRAEQPGAVQT
jgi:hypothetical protein